MIPFTIPNVCVFCALCSDCNARTIGTRTTLIYFMIALCCFANMSMSLYWRSSELYVFCICLVPLRQWTWLTFILWLQHKLSFVLFFIHFVILMFTSVRYASLLGITCVYEWVLVSVRVCMYLSQYVVSSCVTTTITLVFFWGGGGGGGYVHHVSCVFPCASTKAPPAVPGHANK